MRIALPWPDPALFPNRKTHWAPLHKAKARAKADAFFLAVSEKRPEIGAGPVHVRLTFCPPNGIRRDIDGLLSSMKAQLDGIAEALRVDDSRFEIALARGAVTPGGAVIVEINP